MKIAVVVLFAAVVAAIVLYATGVLSPQTEAVHVYVAVDRAHSEPILEAFQKETGITLDITYDNEQTKTVGHVTRIIAEQKGGTPKCDVFWNNESLQTVRLKQMGYLEKYVSPQAVAIPALFKDSDGCWAGFGARARILIVNAELVPDPAARPESFRDLANPAWRERCTLARPEIGTTLTHVAVLFNDGLLGLEGAKQFLAQIRENHVALVTSNGQTMAQVRDGQMAWGFTDTDDFNHAREKVGDRVVAVYPDQGEGELGTMVIPNTVCICKGAPHLEGAKKLVDYILRPETEAELANGRSRQIPVRPDVPHPDDVRIPGKDFRAMEVDWGTAAKELEARLAIMREILR